MFEVPASFISFPAMICVYLQVFQGKNQTVGGVENLRDIQVSVCYILKHSEDWKA